jgi:hypothetical protein
MVLAAAEPDKDRGRIEANVRWLERTQIQQGDSVPWAGSWSYTAFKGRPGDNSNTQYALLGLQTAREVGVRVTPQVWTLSREYWQKAQNLDVGWAYTPDTASSTGSMTCSGISSLAIARHWSPATRGQERLVGGKIVDCGKDDEDLSLQGGIDWMGRHFQVDQNPGSKTMWKYYYLYSLERAGRLGGIRLLGGKDWYREGALHLLHEQNTSAGFWQGAVNGVRQSSEQKVGLSRVRPDLAPRVLRVVERSQLAAGDGFRQRK